MVDMLADDSDAKKHHDLHRTEIERSETNVVIVAEAIVGSEMKSTLASAPNASASITSRSISEIADAPDEIQYNLSFCSILNGLMKPTIASTTITT
jgi:hypothetical protein